MNRRALLKRATGVAAAVGLAGCSQFSSSDSSPSTTETEPRVVDRVVLRSDTDREEHLDVTLFHVDPDGDKRRPLWGVFDVPASGNLYQLSDFEGHRGVYSLTVHSHEHNSVETVVKHAGPDDDIQFEVVVQRHDAVWANVGDAGTDISISNYSPDDVPPS